MGATYSFFSHNYHNLSGSGVNLDAGMVHRFNRFTLSVFAQNIVPNGYVSYSNRKAEGLPFYISSTIRYKYKDITVYPQLKYGQSMVLFSGGLEYNPPFMTFLKGLVGYKQQLDYTLKRHHKLTLGVELELAGLQIQYAYERSEYFLLDHNNYISFSYNM